MESKIGIDNLKIMFKSIARLSSITANGLSDGIGASDVMSLIDVLKIANELKEADFSAMPQEFFDLDEEERNEIFELFKEEFDLENDFIEDVIEQILEGLAQLIPAIFAIAKRFKL